MPPINLYGFELSISLHNPQCLVLFDIYILLSHSLRQISSGIKRYLFTSSHDVPHLLPCESRITLPELHSSIQSSPFVFLSAHIL